MALRKWQLLSTRDVSPHRWFPLEMRIYRLPNGSEVEFSVTTLPDVALVVPLTVTGELVLVKQYKPGVDEIMIQFPAGRVEPNHGSLSETAMHELNEETGILVDSQRFEYVARLSGFSTKATEIVHVYFVDQCQVNSQQHLDPTEEIELVFVKPSKLDELILSGEIWCSQTIAAWELVKQKFGAHLKPV